MKDSSCPSCLKPISADLYEQPYESNEVAPRKFGLSLPRALCPHCGVRIKSSRLSLVIFGVLSFPGFLLFAWSQTRAWPQNAIIPSTVAAAIGMAWCLAAVYVGQRFHRWEDRE